MELVVIYGPPAAGKLTVAKELEKITGFKVFHNHLTGDIASTIYEFNSEPYKKFVEKLREMIFKEAAKSDTKMIFTFVYGRGLDDKFVKKLIKISKKKKDNKIHFVQLNCDRRELEKRVMSSGRKKYGKLRSKKGLKECFGKWDMKSPIPFVDNVSIDNTDLSPKKSAEKIKKELGLD